MQQDSGIRNLIDQQLEHYQGVYNKKEEDGMKIKEVLTQIWDIKSRKEEIKKTIMGRPSQ